MLLSVSTLKFQGELKSQVESLKQAQRNGGEYFPLSSWITYLWHSGTLPMSLEANDPSNPTPPSFPVILPLRCYHLLSYQCKCMLSPLFNVLLCRYSAANSEKAGWDWREEGDLIWQWRSTSRWRRRRAGWICKWGVHIVNKPRGNQDLSQRKFDNPTADCTLDSNDSSWGIRYCVPAIQDISIIITALG